MTLIILQAHIYIWCWLTKKYLGSPLEINDPFDQTVVENVLLSALSRSNSATCNLQNVVSFRIPGSATVQVLFLKLHSRVPEHTITKTRTPFAVILGAALYDPQCMLSIRMTWHAKLKISVS